MNNQQRRDTELEFYFIIRKLYLAAGNVDLVYELIEGLRFLMKYNSLNVQHCAEKMFSDTYYVPYKGELVTSLYITAKMSIRELAILLGASRPTVQKLIEMYQDEPMPHQPVFTEEQDSDLKLFNTTYKKMKELF